MEKQDWILKEKKIKWTADAKFATTYISNRNLQKLQLTLFDKTKRWKIYIYKAHSLLKTNQGSIKTTRFYKKIYH